ncbi:hypothetical protein CBL_01533 [Carabus blaptoides fortunei]
MHHTFTMKSLLILIILLTAATISLCRKPEKKEKFVIVVKEAVEDSPENLETNPYNEVLPASYGPISGNGFMVVYPNGMAKVVEPMNNGMVGNDLKSEPTGFSNDGIYYHDGLKEYEFQMEDKPVNANDRDRLGKAVLYCSQCLDQYEDNRDHITCTCNSNC